MSNQVQHRPPDEGHLYWLSEEQLNRLCQLSVWAVPAQEWGPDLRDLGDLIDHIRKTQKMELE